LSESLRNGWVGRHFSYKDGIKQAIKRFKYWFVQEMGEVFEINSKLEIKNSKLLLADDVWTSGATMLECAKVLKRAGFEKVWGLTFARGGR
jgi:orotate phosphoribosyltransferase